MASGLSNDSPAAMVRGVLLTSAWFGLLVAVALALYWGPRSAFGFLAGGIVGGLSFVLLKLLALQVVRLGRRSAGRIFPLLAVKLVLVYGGLAALILWRAFPTLAIVAGFSFPLVIIVLKAAGRAVMGSRLGGVDRVAER